MYVSLATIHQTGGLDTKEGRRRVRTYERLSPHLLLRGARFCIRRASGIVIEGEARDTRDSLILIDAGSLYNSGDQHSARNVIGPVGGLLVKRYYREIGFQRFFWFQAAPRRPGPYQPNFDQAGRQPAWYPVHKSAQDLVAL